ncbi:MAG: hypothetical protein EXR05_01965 [Acetobacteraceae bacterium]|nr:hypothetical protein [Acetobacteraceae bacterium]MSP29698.1 hypothetical protein [Acetobacteraceae bacterium]
MADAKPGLKGRDPRQAGPTTIRNWAAPCPLDHVNRQFIAPRPNVPWVSDFTYVSTWTGFVYVAFIIATYARRIVSWRVSRTAHAGFVLDTLEQALHERWPLNGVGLVHALAKTINGLSWAEVIDRRGPWKSFDAGEFATLEWVDWFNHRQLLEPIKKIPPAEAEDRYCAMLEQLELAAWLPPNSLQ